MARLLITMVISAGLLGCTSPAPTQSSYTALLRDAMVEAARVDEVTNNSEQAVDAVRRWRSGGRTD